MRSRGLRRGVLGAAGLVVSAIPVRHDRVAPLEERAFRLINRLPDAAYPAVWPPMQFGALAAVPVTAGISYVAGRRVLAARLIVAGGAAWTAAKVAKQVRVRGRPARLLHDVRVRGAEASGGGFVSGHAAVATALAAAAVPRVGGRLGRALVILVPVVGASRLYVGAHLPLDALGGASLGFTVEAATGAFVARMVTRRRAGRAVA